MARYLALLGSINVGPNRVKMADLKLVLAKHGLENVTTVAASGNVIFDDSRKPAKLEPLIEQIIGESFGFASCAMVRTKDEVGAAIDENPFHGSGSSHGSDKMVHSIFLSEQPDNAAVDALIVENRSRGGERIAQGERMLFIDFVDGVSESRLSGKFLERRLGCKATARSMNSLKNIFAKMG